MHDSNDAAKNVEPKVVPRVSPPTVFALFPDSSAAHGALEALLQAGFHGEQLGWMAAQDSIPTPANDPATYRATGEADSSSASGQPVAGGDAAFSADAVGLSVSPRENQVDQARDLLVALGGRLVREDGSIEKEAA